jgi:hypothetical protein
LKQRAEEYNTMVLTKADSDTDMETDENGEEEEGDEEGHLEKGD